MTSTAPPAPAQPATPGAGDVPTWLPLAAVGTTLLLWASAFVAIRHLGQDFSAGPLSLGRLLVGAAVLGVVALSRGVPRPTRREWVSLVAIGVLWFGVYNVALNEGEQRVDAGTAAMLIQLSPVLIAVLAAVFLDERFTAYLGLGLALAFGGVALISVSTSESAGHDVLGVFLCLLAAVVYSISLILQKPLVARLQAVHVTWLACTVGAASGGWSTSGSSPPRSRSRPTPSRSSTCRPPTSGSRRTSSRRSPSSWAGSLSARRPRPWRTPVARSPWSAWPSPGASPGCAPTLLPLRETAAPPGVGGACADRRVSPHYFSPLLLSKREK